MNIVLGVEVNSENSQQLHSGLDGLALPECNLRLPVYTHPCV